MVQAQQWSSRTATGDPFSHRVFANGMAGRFLHVYIEGDGRPFVTPRRVALDPTPASPLMLELMTLDVAPAIYLGRPCYFETDDPLCDPRWWTTDRYSEQVVNSLNSVLDSIASGYDGIMLFGHSGGGALAMLLAARRADVLGVVTLAGNLDTDAWVNYHQYTPLQNSLNPVLQEPLKASVKQRHLVGSQDRTITPAMLEAALKRLQAPPPQIVSGVSHTCCWEQVWADILAQLPP